MAVRVGSSLSPADLLRLSDLAPVNLFIVAETVAEDCVVLEGALRNAETWEWAAASAHGFAFATASTRAAFATRHPAANASAWLATMFPCRLAAHGRRAPKPPAEAGHVLVWGRPNAPEDDGGETAIARLADSCPQLGYVLSGPLGNVAADRGLATGFSSRHLARELERARLVVVPSREGAFDTGLLQALAAGRPVVARGTSRHREILAGLDAVSGVRLFDTDAELVVAFKHAMAETASHADDRRTIDWDEWAATFSSFCLTQASSPSLFGRLVRRLEDVELWSGRVERAEPDPTSDGADSGAAANRAGALTLDDLLNTDGAAFVRHAYATLLRRPADVAGVEFYESQLRDGVDKLEVLRSLAVSPEGRARDVRLTGLEARLAARERPLRRFLRRMFGR